MELSSNRCQHGVSHQERLPVGSDIEEEDEDESIDTDDDEDDHNDDEDDDNDDDDDNFITGRSMADEKAGKVLAGSANVEIPEDGKKVSREICGNRGWSPVACSNSVTNHIATATTRAADNCGYGASNIHNGSESNLQNKGLTLTPSLTLPTACGSNTKEILHNLKSIASLSSTNSETPASPLEGSLVPMSTRLVVPSTLPVSVISTASSLSPPPQLLQSGMAYTSSRSLTTSIHPQSRITLSFSPHSATTPSSLQSAMIRPTPQPEKTPPSLLSLTKTTPLQSVITPTLPQSAISQPSLQSKSAMTVPLMQSLTAPLPSLQPPPLTQLEKTLPFLQPLMTPTPPKSPTEEAPTLLDMMERPDKLDNCRHDSTTSVDSSTIGSRDDLSAESLLEDFQILKSAMKKSCEESPTRKRRLSLLQTVMRRVSIHRKESTPTGRIATFLFGVEDPASGIKEMHEEERKEGAENGHVEASSHSKKTVNVSQLRESLFLILSGLYGIIVVILGAVIPITEIFIPDSLDKAFESFYVYLYILSMLFLGYVYAYLLRRNRLKTELLTRTLSRSLSWTRARAGKSGLRGSENYAKGKLRKRMISLDVSNHHTGTFYLRLGVLGFGVGSMIHSGLNFGAFFSVSDTTCNQPLQAIKPITHLVFTFSQLYFIFMNSKMCIHRYKKLARFGLMHMCATNICVWFRAIVVETLHVIHSQAHHEGGGNHGGKGHHEVGDSHGGRGHHGSVGHEGDVDIQLSVNFQGVHQSVLAYPDGPVFTMVNKSMNLGRKLLTETVTHVNESSSAELDDLCQWSEMMGKAVESAGPYLYPCTIEYSLMCAGILYIMWKNVGKRPRRPRGSELGDDEDDQRVHRMSVDCTGSSRGLFLGILVMVGTIISIIAFYMLNTKDESRLSGIILTHLSETAIYTVTLIALFMAAYRMKTLTFHNEHEADLEDVLILISYTGLLAFIIFSLVASILSKPDTTSGLTILSNIVMLIQATVQTIFMLAGDRMSASTEVQERKKPGREFITFLLISNFAMWTINTFETQTPQHNPIQVEFYGPEAWAIFTHISVPLGIYYRFHSTVCFSNIWKNAWKKRKH